MDKTIIEYLREQISECPFLDEFSGGVHVDYTVDDSANYGIYPTGEQLLSSDTAGNERYQYNFALLAVQFSEEDEARLQSAGFLERFSRWLRRFNRIGMNLGAGNDFESIHAGNGMFMERAADGQTSIYQISCNLIYERMV